jgi:ubiquinone biosynthesis protein
MKIAPHHLKRYKDIAGLFLKYGRSDVVEEFGLDEPLDQANEREPADPRQIRPEDLADDLERMGPTYIKLGQILSSRADLLPARYLKALARLQDQVKPFPYEEVERIVETELGARISKAFSSFDKEPLAAASLGQVHRAALRDGRAVAVKIQRPDIRKQIADDLEVIDEIVHLLHKTDFGRQYQVVKIFEEFQRTLIQELDYRREAANMVAIRKNLEEFPLIKIPQLIADYSTRSILTMEYMAGRKITSMSPLIHLEIDGCALADEVFKAYLKQVLVDGVFHADPHPGNVFLTEDNRIALLDLGMVGRISPGMQEQLLKLLFAVSEGESDTAADLAIMISDTTAQFDEAEFRRRISTLVAEQRNNTLGQLDVGKAILELGRSAGENGLYVPTELTLLGKTLLQLDQIGKSLDPGFNPNAAIKRHVTDMVNRKMRKHLSAGKLLTSMIEMKEFIGGLPVRANKIMDTFANGQFEAKIHLADANLLLQGFQKIANRITMGLVLAALIVGASLLMQVDTKFQILGYPGLAMLCFIAAAGGGFWLVINILIADTRDKRGPD